MEKINLNYAAIGSREATGDIRGRMTDLTYYLSKLGCQGRSGAADGMDTAAYIGAEIYADLSGDALPFTIWLPWSSFYSYEADRFSYAYKVFSKVDEEFAEKKLIESGVCKNIKWLKENKQGVYRLFCRNVYQIFIDEDMLVDFVVYWCKEDEETRKTSGGTKIAVELARYYGVPTYNIGFEKDLYALRKKTGYDYRQRYN